MRIKCTNSIELSHVSTSIVDDKVHTIITQKSHLKTELPFQKSHRGVKKNSYFLDGCALLWVVAWPGAGNAVIQDYTDAFRAHDRLY